MKLEQENCKLRIPFIGHDGHGFFTLVSIAVLSALHETCRSVNRAQFTSFTDD